MAIHLPTEKASREELHEINKMIFEKLHPISLAQLSSYGKHGLIPDYFADEAAAMQLLGAWLRAIYKKEDAGNYLTIRDTRKRIGNFAWSKFRVSLYYRHNWIEKEPRWWTVKNRSLAYAITYSVIQALINSSVVTIDDLLENRTTRGDK